MGVNYSERIDKLIYGPTGLSEWPTDEIAALVAAVYDQRGATVEKSQAVQETILENIPKEEVWAH